MSFKSLRTQLIDGCTELRRRGKGSVAESIMENKTIGSFEEALAEVDRELRETKRVPTRKNLGAPVLESIDESERKQSLFEGYKRLGLNEAEAKLAAGFRDAELAAGIKRGDVKSLLLSTVQVKR